MEDDFKKNLETLMGFMSFRSFSLNHDSEGNRISLFIDDREINSQSLPGFINAFDHVVKLMFKKISPEKTIFVDVNNYRHEREGLILELARGAARKAVGTKVEINLPAMNAYERRLIHAELASRPDVKTESVGEGKNRYVVVKPILE